LADARIRRASTLRGLLITAGLRPGTPWPYRGPSPASDGRHRPGHSRGTDAHVANTDHPRHGWVAGRSRAPHHPHRSPSRSLDRDPLDPKDLPHALDPRTHTVTCSVVTDRRQARNLHRARCVAQTQRVKSPTRKAEKPQRSTGPHHDHRSPPAALAGHRVGGARLLAALAACHAAHSDLGVGRNRADRSAVGPADLGGRAPWSGACRVVGSP